ncbi:hypothetical protein D3C72_1365590 [compost metagenome]
MHFSQGHVEGTGVFHPQAITAAGPAQCCGRVVGDALQALRPIKEFEARTKRDLQVVMFATVGAFRRRRHIQHVEPEHRFVVGRQLRAREDQAQRLAATGLDTADGRRQYERCITGIRGLVGVATVDPGLHQRGRIAHVVDLHGDFARLRRVDHSRAIDHHAGQSVLAEGQRERCQQQRPGKDCFHRNYYARDVWPGAAKHWPARTPANAGTATISCR